MVKILPAMVEGDGLLCDGVCCTVTIVDPGLLPYTNHGMWGELTWLEPP